MNNNCLHRIYNPILAGQTDVMPTLSDYFKVLGEYAEEKLEAKSLYSALELYVKGSMSTFAHSSNVNTDNRVVVYDIKELGKQLKSLGMMVVLENLWDRIVRNRLIGRRTRIYIDEIYLLFQNEQSANFLYELYKRARKWGGIPTGITQNVEDLLKSETGRSMLAKYISIKPSDDTEARAVRTKTLGDEYTEENLIKRISDKQSYVNKTEEKIKTTTGIEREFYIGVQRTVTVIFSGNKIPKKYNPAKSYSINNDWHINELASQINFINREHINSATELENLIEKSGANILQQQSSLNKITEMQSSMRDVIAKAEFYFANKDKQGDAMFTAKLATAKETADKFNISSLEDLAPLKNQYSENIKTLSQTNSTISELQKKQSALLKLQETHQALTNGKYIDNLIEKQKMKKEQDLK